MDANGVESMGEDLVPDFMYRVKEKGQSKITPVFLQKWIGM